MSYYWQIYVGVVALWGFGAGCGYAFRILCEKRLQ
jgi:hypothetical protein